MLHPVCFLHNNTKKYLFKSFTWTTMELPWAWEGSLQMICLCATVCPSAWVVTKFTADLWATAYVIWRFSRFKLTVRLLISADVLAFKLIGFSRLYIVRNFSPLQPKKASLATGKTGCGAALAWLKVFREKYFSCLKQQKRSKEYKRWNDFKDSPLNTPRREYKFRNSIFRNSPGVQIQKCLISGTPLCDSLLDFVNVKKNFYRYCCNIFTDLIQKAVADLRGARGTRAPPWPKISSFSCSFRQKLVK